jgi:hypothetical protein
MFRALGLLAFATCIVVGSASRAAALCIPSFPYDDGWLGGDAAYSIRLSDTKSVWLFGDSFIGDPGRKTRSGSKMVSNTIAISSCANGSWSIRYYWRSRGAKVPQPFFTSLVAQFHYWPLDGFYVNGMLYVALAKIVDLPKGGPFGFEMIGVRLAKISSPLDDPTRWTINYLDLSDSRVAFPGVTTIVSRDYVYLYAVLDDAQDKSHPMILARIAIAQLDRPRDSIRYLTNDGAWKAGIDLKNARIIIDRGATEMSVRYHASINKWIAVQNGPQPLSREIVIRKAPALEGPWSAPEPIYSFPEMSKGNPRFDRDTFCYAAKEHTEFTSATGSTAVTYVCNSLELGKQIGNMSIYRPQLFERNIR